MKTCGHMSDANELCAECRLHGALIKTQRVLAATRNMVQVLLATRTPCIRCTFALATHGKHDAAFGVGAPRLCVVCTDEYPDEDWRIVELHAYDNLSQRALNLLEDGAIVLDTLCPTCPVDIHPAGTPASDCASCQAAKVRA